MRAGRRAFWLIMVVAVGTAFWYLDRPKQVQPLLQRAASSQGAVHEDHFSPAENLEQLDKAEIDHAQHSIDIAMYAFTDRYLADAILQAARRGVKVRIYRDHSQYEEEERSRKDSTSSILVGQPNIQLRVKHVHELMHLKAYCIDGAVLRDGSANWSPSGLKRQDNNAHFTTDPRQIQTLNRTLRACGRARMT